MSISRPLAYEDLRPKQFIYKLEKFARTAKLRTIMIPDLDIVKAIGQTAGTNETF